MKVIILEKFKGLGNKWDIKDVKDGYARNFLLPKKMAQIATKEAVMSIKKQKEEIGQHRDELKDAAEKAAKKFSGKEFHFYPEIGENNEVFGSISKKDIKETIEKELDFLRENFIKIFANSNWWKNFCLNYVLLIFFLNYQYNRYNVHYP